MIQQALVLLENFGTRTLQLGVLLVEDGEHLFVSELFPFHETVQEVVPKTLFDTDVVIFFLFRVTDFCHVEDYFHQVLAHDCVFGSFSDLIGFKGEGGGDPV